MSRDILPTFEAIEDRQAAEALSEPFIRPEDYTTLPETELGEVDPIAVGVAYITDEGEVEYGFALVEETDVPLAAAQEFSEGYDRTVGFYHARDAEIASDLGSIVMSGGTQNQGKVIEKATALKLRTVAGFTVFASSLEDPKMQSTFFLTTKAFEELPLDGRGELFDITGRPGGLAGVDSLLLRGSHDIADIRKAQRGIMQNDEANRMYGVAISALLLPEPKVAKKQLAEDPRVGDFLKLPRKQRRKLLKEEKK